MNNREKEGPLQVPKSEQEKIDEYHLKCIAPNGLGYGEGTISAADRQTASEYPVSREQLQRAIDVIVHRSGDVIVPIEEYDDGCGDGRPTEVILRKDLEADSIVTYNKSKKRAKIFGGGLLVAASMWRAIRGKADDGDTVLGDRQFIASELKARNVHYGGHTDNRAQGENCGCGAIDKYGLSVQLGNQYRDQITDTLAAFIDTPSENTGVIQAFSTREALAGDQQYLSNASGRATMDLMLESGALIKELGDDHFEAIVLMNDQPNMTVDQEMVATILRQAGLPDKIQVFVVDIWRGRQYAEVVADIAAEHGYNRELAQQTALADFFIQQLAVSTTLTKGDLPVILNS